MDFPEQYASVPIWASSHHELLHGSGYPNGLSQDSIPREVRLLTILDIFEALTAKDRPYKTPFSFDVQEGGYIHENGDYTRENSLVLTLIDADKTVTNEIAKDLCTFFHQESVLITEANVRTYYVSDALK